MEKCHEYTGLLFVLSRLPRDWDQWPKGGLLFAGIATIEPLRFSVSTGSPYSWVPLQQRSIPSLIFLSGSGLLISLSV